MVANDHGNQIGIHGASPPSISIGETKLMNPHDYNYDEDKGVVPVILTCENKGLPPANATAGTLGSGTRPLPPADAAAGTPGSDTRPVNGIENMTVVTMYLVLDVETPQIISKSVTAILRELEVRILQKLSEVVCPSAINYLQYNRDRRTQRSPSPPESDDEDVQMYKFVDLTSHKFDIGKIR